MDANLITILILVLLVALVFVVRWVIGNLFSKIDDKIHNSRVEKNRKETNASNSENLADKYK